MTDTNYRDDLVLLANITAYIKSLLHSLEQVAVSIRLNLHYQYLTAFRFFLFLILKVLFLIKQVKHHYIILNTSFLQ